MYSVTRQDAAETLGVSTRSIDRYVKSGKLRSKKEGKIIYIHSSDIKNLSGESTQKVSEVIIPKEKSYSAKVEERESSSRELSTENSTLEKIYNDLRSEIKIKDTAIQDLSIKLGQAQEIAKNSVSLIEFKKSQFLLEESKGYLSSEVGDLKEKNSELKDKLKYEKSTNTILIVFCVILMIGFGLLWFIQI